MGLKINIIIIFVIVLTSSFILSMNLQNSQYVLNTPDLLVNISARAIANKLVQDIENNIDYASWFNLSKLTLEAKELIKAELFKIYKSKIDNLLFNNQVYYDIISVAIDPDNNFIVTGSDDYRAIKWDIKTHQTVSIFSRHKGSVSDVKISSDGSFIVTASEDCTARIWDIKTAKCLSILEGHEKAINSVAISLDNKLIVTGSHDEIIKIWGIESSKNIFSSKCLFTLKGHEDRVTSVDISPDNRLVVSGSSDGTIRIWNIETTCLKTLEYTSEIISVKISKSGEFIVAAFNDGKVQILDIAGQLLLCFRCHKHSMGILALALSSDSKYIATGSKDRKIKVWDIKTGKKLLSFSDNYSCINSLAISNNTKFLIAGFYNGTARLRFLGFFNPELDEILNDIKKFFSK